MEEHRLPTVLGQRVKKTEKNKFGFFDVNLNELKIDSPVVFCFGGSGVVERISSNGFAKFVFNLLNTNPKNTDLKVYSLTYGSEDTSPMDGTLTYDEVQSLVHSIFVPLVSKNGEKIDVLEAQKNMRNITIVSHCFGMAVSNIISSLTADEMHKLGYKNGEIRDILKEVTNISYAPLKANVTPLFSTIDFYSMEDRYKKSYSPLQTHLPKDKFATTIFNEKENHLSVVAKSFVGSFEKGLNPFDEHSLGIIKRTKDWKSYPKEHFDAFYPEEQKYLLKKYKTLDNLFSRTETISECFSLCLAESVSSSYATKDTNKLVEVDFEKINNNINYFIDIQEKAEEKNGLRKRTKTITSSPQKHKQKNGMEFC